MKTAGTGLLSYLTAAQGSDTTLLMARLYTLTLANGTVLRYTDYDRDLTVGGNTFLASSGPIITCKRTRQAVGVELSEMELSLGRVRQDGGTFAGYATVPAAVFNGALDNAKLEVDKLFMPSPGDTSLGALVWFVGLVSEVTARSSGADLVVKSTTELLANLQWPKRRLMPHCPYSLYDANCGVTKAPVTVTVQSGPTSTVVTVSGLTHGPYVLGTITFADGEVRQIQSMATSGSNDALTLNFPLAKVPLAGASATVLIGCNKTNTTPPSNSASCISFNNTARFGGFPWVPRPESIR